MKREYPLFTIDRTKSEAYPFDFVVCHDRTVGFVAKVVHLTVDELLSDFFKHVENSETEIFSYVLPLNKGGLILKIVDFTHDFELTAQNRSRIATLLKKCMKKYVHAEVELTAHGGLDIENQIKAQQETVARAKATYETLLARCNGERNHADYLIALNEAIIETLKRYRDNIRYFAIKLN
ncbi:hypothetical protein AGMMS49525_10300 [Bacteroidia bacterium]|nr:hypothetical protein AGMMS49525_10300 [Bacteroidia bacterium]